MYLRQGMKESFLRKKIRYKRTAEESISVKGKLRKYVVYMQVKSCPK